MEETEEIFQILLYNFVVPVHIETQRVSDQESDGIYEFILGFIIFSSSGQSPGRAIILTPALASALVGGVGVSKML